MAAELLGVEGASAGPGTWLSRYRCLLPALTSVDSFLLPLDDFIAKINENLTCLCFFKHTGVSKVLQRSYVRTRHYLPTSKVPLCPNPLFILG